MGNLVEEKRVVIVSEDWGVYLGSCMGLGFWSNLDPAGQEAAVTFVDEEEAIVAMAEWESSVLDTALHMVDADMGQYISKEKLAELGLPTWEVTVE